MRVGKEIVLVGQRVRSQPAALGPFLRQEGVPQCAQEITEIVLVAQKTRTGEHAGVGLLDQVFRILAGTGERPSGPVEPVEVVSEPGGVKRALHP